jgi:hypothetical protein
VWGPTREQCMPDRFMTPHPARSCRRGTSVAGIQLYELFANCLGSPAIAALASVSCVLCPLSSVYSRTRTVGRILRICVGLAQLYEYSCTGTAVRVSRWMSPIGIPTPTFLQYSRTELIVPLFRRPDQVRLQCCIRIRTACIKNMCLLLAAQNDCCCCCADSDQRVGTVHVKKLIPTDLSEMMSQQTGSSRLDGISSLSKNDAATGKPISLERT